MRTRSPMPTDSSRQEHTNFDKKVDFDERTKKLKTRGFLDPVLSSSKPVKLVDWSEKIAKESRINQIGFLQYTSTLLRQSILGYYGNIKANSQTEEKLSRSLIERIEFNGLEIFHNKISDSIMHIERNANAKILFLNLSLELSNLFKKRT